jgi:hypothetical protein
MPRGRPREFDPEKALDAALAWASKAAAAVRRPIEVRPFRDAQT